MKNHHKAFKAAVIVLAAFVLFIAPVHDAMIQTPPVELYAVFDGCIDDEAISIDYETTNCSEFLCCSLDKLLSIRSDDITMAVQN
jgi:hypothetical protein